MSWFYGLSLKAKILFSVTIACFICATMALGVANYFNKKEFHAGLVEKSRIVHSRMNAATHYVATQGGLKSIIEYYTKKYKSSDELTKEDIETILKQVPIYSAMKIGAFDQEKDNYTFRMFSDEPRNKNNTATEEEIKVFKKFQDDPSLTEYVKDADGEVVVYRPVRLYAEQGCFNCHGDPATSPWGNGKDILGMQMENWKEGKLHGVFAIHNNVKEAQTVAAAKVQFSNTTLLTVFIAMGAVLALIMSALIAGAPIRELQEVSNELQRAGEQVSAASVQIAGSSNALSQSATEQASSLEETAASLEEISAMIAKSTDNSKLTAESSTQSQEKVLEGQEAVQQMMSSMDEINNSNASIMNQVTRGNEQMTEIVKVIEEIGTRTKVINDIVFQTKLLSFNASVEAARAGEHGKGFAVVAEEVGNLAQMSGNAAKEISTMLEDSMRKVESIVAESKDKIDTLIAQGKEKVEAGLHVAKKCGEALNHIVENVDAVSRLAGEISTASREQAAGVSEINKAIGQLDQVTQQNASASEETASAAQQLSHQASEMRESVLRLISVVDGAKSQSHHVGVPTQNTKRRSQQGQSGHMASSQAAPDAKEFYNKAA